VLAEGTKRMAEKYNQGSEYYAIQVKGLELPAMTPGGQSPRLELGYLTIGC